MAWLRQIGVIHGSGHRQYDWDVAELDRHVHGSQDYEVDRMYLQGTERG
jgi:hypothetical protein